MQLISAPASSTSQIIQVAPPTPTTPIVRDGSSQPSTKPRKGRPPSQVQFSKFSDSLMRPIPHIFLVLPSSNYGQNYSWNSLLAESLGILRVILTYSG